MVNRTLTAAISAALLLTAPGLSHAQSVDMARGDLSGSNGGVAAPARTSADQIRADIWSNNAERKAEFARKDAEYKAALAAYDAETARLASESVRIQSDAEARQAAYEADLAAYHAKVASCRETLGRGCRWPSPPPRRYHN